MRQFSKAALGWELPLDAFHTNSSFGPGTFPMLPFARDFAKVTICALLPFASHQDAAVAARIADLR
jgi:hypothetical protein